MNAFGAQVTIPNADVKVWIIAPIMRAISFLGDETKFLATSHRSFIAMQHSMTLLAVARQFAIEKGAAQHGIEKIGELMRHTKGVDDWANEVVSSDFATPNMHSLIASWGAIEVAVEDTFVLTLLKRPDVALFKVASCRVARRTIFWILETGASSLSAWMGFFKEPDPSALQLKIC